MHNVSLNIIESTLKKVTHDKVVVNDIRMMLRQEKSGFIDNMEWAFKATCDETFFLCYDNGSLIGFCLGELDIFYVKTTQRRSGVGTAFARFILKLISKQKSCLPITCAPPESLAFWETLGFNKHRVGREQIFANILFHKKIPLPDGEAKSVCIEYYPNSADDGRIKPFKTLKIAGVKLNNTIHLSERASAYNPEDDNPGDSQAKIIIDDVVFFWGKVKHVSGRRIGFLTDYGVYIDYIVLDD
jgi:hypothetical protein